MARHRSRFDSERARDLALALIMLVVLAGALGAGYALTGRRGRGAHTLRLTRKQVGDLRVYVPKKWPLQKPGNLPPRLRSQAVRLVDPDRSSRRITLLRVVASSPASGPQVMKKVVPLLIGRRAWSGLKLAGRRTFFEPRRGLRVMEWVGVGQRPGEAGPRFDLAADLSARGREHWMIYLRDVVGRDENRKMVLQADLGLFRAIHQSAQIVHQPTGKSETTSRRKGEEPRTQ